MTDTLSRPRPADVAESREDPRIARRRKGVEAEKRHRRRVVLFAVAGVVTAFAALYAVTRSPLLDVDHVGVSGADRVDRDAVIRASGIRVGDALVDVDLAAIRTAVMAVPGVASARVEREWPDAIRIVITGEEPLAVLAGPQQRVVVARGGRVVAAAPASDDPSVSALPSIVTADGVEVGTLTVGAQVPDKFVPAVVVLEQLPASLSAGVDSVEVAADGSLSLLLRNNPALGFAGGRVELGTPDGLPAKLLSASSMAVGARMSCLDVLDVREPSRPTITRVSGCDAGQPTVGATTVPTTTVPAKSAGTVPKSATTVPAKSAGTVPKKSATTLPGRAAGTSRIPTGTAGVAPTTTSGPARIKAQG